MRQLTQGAAQRRGIERGEVTLTEQRLGRRDDRSRSIRPVHESGDLLGEAALRRTSERLALHEPCVLLDLGAREEREDLEPLDDVAVERVEPELIERVRTAHLGVEPDGVALALAELGAVAVRDQGVPIACTEACST